MDDLRIFMEGGTNTMPTILFNYREVISMSVLGNHTTDIAQAVTRFDLLNAEVQTFLSDLN